MSSAFQTECDRHAGDSARRAEDRARRHALASDGGPVTPSDGAAPVIVSATSTTLTVTFSEPVDTSNIGVGDLVLTDFTYTDVSSSGVTEQIDPGA